MVEMIVIVVVIGVLVAVSAFGYVSFTNNSKNKATEVQLTQIAKAMIAAHATSPTAGFEEGHLAQATADTAPLYAIGLTASGMQVVIDGWSRSPSVLSAAFGRSPAGSPEVADYGKPAAYLALKSAGGDCAMAAVEGTDVRTKRISDYQPNECSGIGARNEWTGSDDELPEVGDLGTPVLSVEYDRGMQQAVLTWTTVPGAGHYRVFRDDEPVHGLQNVTAANARVSIPQPDAESIHTTFRVQAVGDEGESAHSTPVALVVECLRNDMMGCAYILDTPQPNETLDEGIVNNSDFTRNNEPGEPSSSLGPDRYTAWWKITPTADANYRFHATTAGLTETPLVDINSFKVAVWTNASGAPDVHLWHDGAVDAHVLRAGETYWVQVGLKFSNDSGHFRFFVTRGPANSTVSTAEVVAAAAGGEVDLGVHDNRRAGTDEGEPRGPGTASPKRHTLWWKFMPAADANYRFHVTDAGVAESPLVDFSRIAVAIWNDQDNHPDSVLGTGSPVELELRAGETYWAQIGMRSGDATGHFRLTVSRGPTNDAVSAAEVIPPPGPEGETVLGVYDNRFAGIAADEPQGGLDAPAQKTLWWKITPIADATYRFSGTTADLAETPAINLDHLSVAIWEDENNQPGSLLRNGTKALVDYELQAGETYWIQAGQRRASTSFGHFRFSVTRGPVNDTISSAESIATPPVGGAVDLGVRDNRTAGASANEPQGGTNAPRYNTMWWKFTPSATGSYRFMPQTVSGESAPLVTPNEFLIAVWDNSGNHPGELVSSARWMDLEVQAGETYWVQTGMTKASGAGHFRIEVKRTK